MNKSEIAKLIKEYHNVRNERLALDEASKKLAVQEASILDQLTAADVESGKYGSYMVKVKSKMVPRCTDWNSFHAWVKDTGSFDCLHKRLTDTAINARLENGELVPGIVTDEKKIYSFTVA